ncbi:FtsX-like permease family protein [Paractinoplanes rishiriensis]|uniref:ABC transporter permease n=1 Tax=Paractinoplanes rishiriensis TaxID=1050105 RepID=A0A919K1H5_9ACTN|nr:ABC transporter permease [Actinoplanes rishiriensis]GIE97315.1 ABC transporter permease [Actinoplanes rishiriensis]
MSLAWQMVRHRFASFAGTFVAIALGVAVIAGSTTVYLSSRPEAPARYAAAAVLVHAPEAGDTGSSRPDYRTWPAAEATALAGRLAGLPGVSAAAADPAFYVQRLDAGRPVGDPEAARIDGHAWSSTVLGGYRLITGTAPRRPGEVAVAGAAPGTRIDVLTAAGPATWTVTGTVDGPGFYLADEVALPMAAGVRVIGLTVDGDTEEVATAARGIVGAGDVLTGAARDELEPENITRTRWLGAQLLIAMVTLGAFVAVFVVASTCALSAAQRRREIGLLRAVGATPGQVRRMMYAETLVVAVLGGLAGLPLGGLAALTLDGPLVAAGLEPAGFQVTTQPAALAGAFLTGVVVALAGAGVAARRASRNPALDALREAAVERRAMPVTRWIAGLACAALGLLLVVRLGDIPVGMQSTAGLGSAMLLLTAAALLAPVVIGPLVRAVTWPWRRAATGMLVREGTLVAVRRVASTAAPVILTVGFTVLLTGTVATITNVQGIDEAADIPAATVLAPDGVPGLSEAVVQAQPGTARLGTRVLITRDGTTTAHDAAAIRGGRPGGAPAVTLDRATAGLLHAGAGTRLDLVWADGTSATLPVAAVVADGPGLTVPWDLVRRHDPNALAGAVLLSGPAVAAPGAKVMTARDYVQVAIDEEGRLVDLFLAVLIGLSVGYTGLAVANTLLMATAARRPEFRALRLAGATTGQVLRVTTAEALLAVAVGTALGALVAGTSLNGVVAAVEAELDRTVPLVVPWTAALTVTAACLLVAVAATALPVLRHRGTSS